jgi:type IV pilus biogenesis protein PilP
MKPNFALDFSRGDVSLLHRHRSGWSHVGNVSLDDPDMANALKMLRRTASEMTTAPICTKIVLPNDQVLYTELTLQRGDAIAQIRTHLEGLTPYRGEELIFDTSGFGATIQIAAVARETLEEAESFAQEHKFNAVSFAAIPKPGEFEGEPFFGETEFAQSWLAGESVERDTRAVTVAEPDPLSDPAVVKKSSDIPVTDVVRLKQQAANHVPLPATAPVKPKPVEPAAQTPTDHPTPAASFSTQRRAKAPSKAAKLTTVHSRFSVLPQSTDPAQAPGVPGFSLQKLGLHAVVRGAGKRLSPLYAALLALIAIAIIAVAASAFNQELRAWLGLGQPTQIALPETDPGTAPQNGLTDTDPTLAELEDEPDLPEEGAMDNDALRTALYPDGDIPADPIYPNNFSTLEDAVDPDAHADLPSLIETKSYYAITGVWQLPPLIGAVPAEGETDSLYLTAIDPAIITEDANLLPAAGDMHDERPLIPRRPLPYDVITGAAPDLVTPTPEGTPNAEGVMVYSGRPENAPAPRPARELIDPAYAALAKLRPIPRPQDLTTRQANLDDTKTQTRNALGAKRPLPRPQSEQNLAQQAPSQDTPTAEETPESKLAIAASPRPAPRPAVKAAAFAKLQQELNAKPPSSKAQVPATVRTAPAIPTRTNVAQTATQKNRLSLGQVSLIGVYGSPSARRALVRLPSGRFVKVAVGDRVNGGRVLAINKSSLSYQKSGRSLVLNMPKDG